VFFWHSVCAYRYRIDVHNDNVGACCGLNQKIPKDPRFTDTMDIVVYIFFYLMSVYVEGDNET
jgi:hypothetical protein